MSALRPTGTCFGTGAVILPKPSGLKFGAVVSAEEFAFFDFGIAQPHVSKLPAVVFSNDNRTFVIESVAIADQQRLPDDFGFGFAHGVALWIDAYFHPRRCAQALLLKSNGPRFFPRWQIPAYR
jgi:hypothetical protein